MTLKRKGSTGLMFMLLGFHGQVFAQGQTTTVAEFTAGQSAEGKTAYDRACLQCHGRYLDDGQFAPPLRATAFSQKRAGQTVEQLFAYISTKMPPDAPGSLNARAYAAITAYVLPSNGTAYGSYFTFRSANPAGSWLLRAISEASSGPCVEISFGSAVTRDLSLPQQR